jgi:hypothetical protein
MTADSKISSRDEAEYELDASSLDAIRSILTEEEAPVPRRTLRRAKPVAAEPPREGAPSQSKAEQLPTLERPYADPEDDLTRKPGKWRFSLRRTPKAAVAKVTAPRTERRKPKDAGEGLAGRIKTFRPKPVHIALGLFALFVVMRPWLVFGVLVLFALIMTGVFLITGYDGFWQSTMKFGRWYARRRPARAALLHARLDRFAMRWDAVLDRFPEGTVDGLYLPDFGEMATAEDRHSKAMDRRLSGMQGKGA